MYKKQCQYIQDKLRDKETVSKHSLKDPEQLKTSYDTQTANDSSK